MVSSVQPISWRDLTIETAHKDEILIQASDLRATAAPGIKWKDLTNEITHVVAHSKIREGVVLAQSRHTTTALIVNENEEGLVEHDIPRFLDRLCLKGVPYMHDREERLRSMLNEPANGEAHIQSVVLSLFAPPVVLAVSNYRVQLGTWQSPLFFDFDSENRPARTVVVQVLGIR